MSKVKICGLMRKEDIEYVNKYRPEYVGFVFAQSKRMVSVDLVKALTGSMNDKIKRVGIFVNEDIKKLLKVYNDCELNIIQLHGEEDAEYIEELRRQLKSAMLLNCRCSAVDVAIERELEIWKAIRVRNEACLNELKELKADAYVLDTYVDGSYGGSGKSFDWSIAKKAGQYGKIVLAGGLKADNVQEAIRIAEPSIVDVSSGVEAQGYKDENKIRNFINAVRNYE